MSEIPDIIAIDHDDYHAEFVGIAENGRQFFLTTPFAPYRDDQANGAEYVALFLFDEDGKLVDWQIENFGPRATMDHDARLAARDRMLAGLGDVSFERIEISPFSIEHDGITFGLIAEEIEPDGDYTVTLEPGNYMAFFEPWDSGDYDT
jgi:hypothetical protein